MSAITSPIQEGAPADRTSPVVQAALSGLRSSPKTLAPWLFYDAAGSDLFEQITLLPEYYLTRTERQLFADHAAEILETAAHGAEARLTMLELGSGSSSKTGLLLAAAVARQGSVSYQPVDVSESALREAEESLTARFPGVDVRPQVANYTAEPFTLEREPGDIALALYIGSSIGNFSPEDARAILRNLRARLIDGDALLLGVDLAPGEGKHIAELVAAYDDAAGVTAAFNRNVLSRLNRECGANFDLSCFAHRAVWNPHSSRMEMHLECLIDQTVTVADERFRFHAGETIHTENSYKFSLADEGSSHGASATLRVETLLIDGGFMLEHVWTDAAQRFAVCLARVRPEASPADEP